MKIVDNFIFCNEYEKEVLLLKLKSEFMCVDEWVGTECEYDYRGNHKGPILQNLIDSDDRFALFRNKIKVISIKDNLSNSNPSLLNTIDPPQFANAEKQLREAATGYILNKYEDGDRILITDVDEIFDFWDDNRRARILGELETQDCLQFDRIRYWWDYDNRSWRPEFDMISPSFLVKHIKEGQAKLSDKKWVGRQIPNGYTPMVFEYCFCFSHEDVHRKYGSSLHTQWQTEEINRSIEENRWTDTSYQQIDFNNRYRWFEKVKLHKNNSIKIVRDNLDSLKTYLVPDNYKAIRLSRHGFDANFLENRDFNG